MGLRMRSGVIAKVRAHTPFITLKFKFINTFILIHLLSHFYDRGSLRYPQQGVRHIVNNRNYLEKKFIIVKVISNPLY